MKPVVFITGNLNKVRYLEMYLDHPVRHVKLDLDEIQSLDSRAIVEHKVRQAYETIHEPVLVEDAALEFVALGRLPGPFIRFFVEEVPMETLCAMLQGNTRRAVARSAFGYCDGTDVRYFEGRLEGEIAPAPAGERGWDWDKIFIPDGYTITRAQMEDSDYEHTSMQLRPFAELKAFLSAAPAALSGQGSQ